MLYSIKKQGRIRSICHRRRICKQNELKIDIIICRYSATLRRVNLRLNKNDYLRSLIRKFLIEEAQSAN